MNNFISFVQDFAKEELPSGIDNKLTEAKAHYVLGLLKAYQKRALTLIEKEEVQS